MGTAEDLLKLPDVDESPARTIERDLASGKSDGAILSGPIAGMLVEQRTKDPKWRAVPFEPPKGD